MKTIVKIASIVFLLVMVVSCGEKVEEKKVETTAPAPVVATEVPAQQTAPANTVPAKSTEIDINTKGATLETKDGNTNTRIKVSEDDAQLKIKK